MYSSHFCSQKHCENFTGEPSGAVGMDRHARTQTPLLSHKRGAQEGSRAKIRALLCYTVPFLPRSKQHSCWQTDFTSPGGTQACPPLTSMHPQPLSCCSVCSEKNGSCSQLPESGPSEADRSRRGRRNMFVSRAREPGSPPNLLPLSPRGGGYLAHPSEYGTRESCSCMADSLGAQVFWHHRADGVC